MSIRARHNRARVAVTKCPRGLSAGPEQADWEFDQWNGKVRVNFRSVWNLGHRATIYWITSSEY